MPPMKVHLGIHLRFAADVHNSTSTCVVQPVIHLCFAADVHKLARFEVRQCKPN